MPFFTNGVNFGNSNGDHHRVISQMLILESRDKITSCTSRQLDKFYEKHKQADLDGGVVARTKKIVKLLGGVFPASNPALNRSYVLGLYWTISRILQTYSIPEAEYPKLLTNFEALDQKRLEAMNREYSKADDEVLQDLSDSMSRGTDGAERITDRYEILTQHLFNDVDLAPLPNLDPRRLFTFEEKLILYRRSGGTCQLECNGKVCGRPIEFEDSVVDHILPHSQGGRTQISNGRLAHKSCNIARGVRTDFDPEAECCLLTSAADDTNGSS